MNNLIYIFVAFVVSYLIRSLPLTLFQKQITNKYFKSFLYYVPYVTLAVMTFPSMIEATQSRLAGIISLIVGIVVAYFTEDLFKTAIAACVCVYVIEFIMLH